MLTQLRRPVRLSFSSTDTLIHSEIETVGTLYQKDGDRFHLLFTEPLVSELGSIFQGHGAFESTAVPTPRLLWLDFSPFRAALTMQGNGQYTYRQLFEPGVFGVSRFWLNNGDSYGNQFRLRNFTRILHVKGSPLPWFLLLEYELWSNEVMLGEYVLNLEIEH
jgi:hypothetical protein